MGKRLRLEPHLSSAELEQRYRAAKEPQVRSWWQILWLLATGHAAAMVANLDALDEAQFARYAAL